METLGNAKVKIEVVEDVFVGQMVKQEIGGPSSHLSTKSQHQYPSSPPLRTGHLPIADVKLEPEQHYEVSTNNLPEEMENAGRRIVDLLEGGELPGTDSEDSDWDRTNTNTAPSEKKIRRMLTASRFLLTVEDFRPCVQKLWSMVFRNDKVLPEKDLNEWYNRVKQTMECHRNILNTAIEVVCLDNGRNVRPKLRTMSSEEIAKAQDQSGELLLERQGEAKRLGLNLSTTYGLMISETSALQIFLSVEFCKWLELRDIMEKEDMADIYWIPTNSDFPFHIFQRLVKLRLDSKNVELQLSSEALRIRYLEFVTKAYSEKGYKNRFQLIAAVFTAFGPNLFSYPVRAIELLQSRNVLRNDLGLARFNSRSSAKTFPAFDSLNFVIKTKKKNSIVLPETKKERRKRLREMNRHNTRSKKSRDMPPEYPSLPSMSLMDKLDRLDGHGPRISFSDAPVPCPGPSSSAPSPFRNSIPKNSANLIPLGPRADGSGKMAPSRSVQHYASWLSESTMGLKRLGLEALSDIEFQEAYNSHLAFCQEPMKSDFMLGVLTGISISLKSQKHQKVEQPKPQPQSTLTTSNNLATPMSRCQVPIPTEPPATRQTGIEPPAISPPNHHFPPNMHSNNSYYNNQYAGRPNSDQFLYYNPGYHPSQIPVQPGFAHPMYSPHPIHWAGSAPVHNLALPPQYTGAPYLHGQGQHPPPPPQHFRQDEIVPPPPPPPPRPPSPPLPNPPMPTSKQNPDCYAWTPPTTTPNNSSSSPIQGLPKPELKSHLPSQQGIPVKRSRPPPPPPPMISSIKMEAQDKTIEINEDPEVKKRKVSGNVTDPSVNVVDVRDSVVFDYSHGQ